MGAAGTPKGGRELHGLGLESPSYAMVVVWAQWVPAAQQWVREGGIKGE